MAQRRAFLFCFFLAVAVAVAARCVPAAVAAVLPMRVGRRYVVGGPDGWRMPPPGSMDMYAKWAAGISFYVDDSIEFVYKNDSVIRVDKFGYYHCNGTAASANDGRALFLLDAPGFAYFSSADVKHCKKGQRLMINVADASPSPEPAPSTTPAPPPSAIATTPAPASPSSSPALPPEVEPTTSAASSLSSSASARALLLALSATAVATMGLILRGC